MLLLIEVFLDGVLKNSSCFILKEFNSKQRVREDLSQRAVNYGGKLFLFFCLFVCV